MWEWGRGESDERNASHRSHYYLSGEAKKIHLSSVARGREKEGESEWWEGCSASFTKKGWERGNDEKNASPRSEKGRERTTRESLIFFSTESDEKMLRPVSISLEKVGIMSRKNMYSVLYLYLDWICLVMSGALDMIFQAKGPPFISDGL